MSKQDFEIGSSSVDRFFSFIRKRHQIYINRFEKKLPKPWTEDPIFQQWKFTNVFRQLDTGTIALHNALRHQHLDDYTCADILFTIIWYRLFNWHEHICNLGMTTATNEDYNRIQSYMLARHEKGERIFTSAHMTTGVAFEDKVVTYLQATQIALESVNDIVNVALSTDSMEETFNELLKLYMVGRFVAYEIVCDLRFTKVLYGVKDNLSWANVGPGAKRGLQRIGMEVSLQSMIDLWNTFKFSCKDKDDIFYPHIIGHLYPPFELREIEHSLCEFDKYERIRLDQGRPRQKYSGV